MDLHGACVGAGATDTDPKVRHPGDSAPLGLAARLRGWRRNVLDRIHKYVKGVVRRYAVDDHLLLEELKAEFRRRRDSGGLPAGGGALRVGDGAVAVAAGGGTDGVAAGKAKPPVEGAHHAPYGRSVDTCATIAG